MRKIISVITAIIIASVMQFSYAINDSQLEINKQNVVEFYDKVINQKDFKGALSYLGSRYIQHNPTAADGPEGLKAFIQFLRDNYINAHSEIKRVFAEGDYVISSCTFNPRAGHTWSGDI